MTTTQMARGVTGAALLAASAIARASGDSGTSAMGEMQIGGAHLAMMFGALVGLGLVVWALAKMLNR